MAAQQDLDDLGDCALAAGAAEAETLCHWDLAFWPRLREQRYDFNDEELRPYFPLPRVLNGLFAWCNASLASRFGQPMGEAPVWHETCASSALTTTRSGLLRPFILTLTADRPKSGEERGWTSASGVAGFCSRPGTRCVSRWPTSSATRPPRSMANPRLVRVNEVKTLFHEFGHGLHHMLTTVDYGLAAGIHDVEWDAVELPSQFMENWCYHRATLMGMSAHVESGEPLPETLYQKLCAARTYRAGSLMLRQLYFACLDFALHHHLRPAGLRNSV